MFQNKDAQNFRFGDDCSVTFLLELDVLALVFSRKYSRFCIICQFLPIPGRILPVLTFNGRNPLNVNAGRILPGIGRKFPILQKLDCASISICCMFRAIVDGEVKNIFTVNNQIQRRGNPTTKISG